MINGRTKIISSRKLYFGNIIRQQIFTFQLISSSFQEEFNLKLSRWNRQTLKAGKLR